MSQDGRRRALLLVSIIVLGALIAIEQSLADAMDSSCAEICATECAGEGGCLFYNPVGCNCQWACESGHDGNHYCGG